MLAPPDPFIHPEAEAGPLEAGENLGGSTVGRAWAGSWHSPGDSDPLLSRLLLCSSTLSPGRGVCLGWLVGALPGRARPSPFLIRQLPTLRLSTGRKEAEDAGVHFFPPLPQPLSIMLKALP